MKKNLSKSQLDALIEEVKTEIDVLLKSEVETMAKTAPGQESPSEDDDNADVSATAPAAPASPAGDAPPAAPDAGPGADGADASAAPPAPDATAAPAPDAAGADPAQDQTMDHGALVAEYSKLPVEEMQSHFLALKEALMTAMGGAGGTDEAAPPAPPAPAAVPPVPAASPSAPPTLKSEIKVDAAANGGMKKSESEKDVEDLRKKVSEQEDALGTLLTAFETVLGQPQRKAVTSLNYVPKTEDAPKALTKSEVQEKLNTITKSSKLSKSDRELINDYCLGNVVVEKIEHLLK